MLQWSLKRTLKRLERKTRPSQTFKKTLWRELEAEYERTHPTPTVRWRARIAGGCLIVIALFIFVETGLYAYASPEVLPDHTLYPLRHALEAAEGTFQFSKKARDAYEARMSRRRLIEAEAMYGEKGMPVLPAHVLIPETRGENI